MARIDRVHVFVRFPVRARSLFAEKKELKTVRLTLATLIEVKQIYNDG